MSRVYAAFLIIALSFAGYALGMRQALNGDAQRGASVLAQASDRLTALIERFRYLPAVVVRSAEVQGFAEADPIVLSDYLRRIADTSGAVSLVITDLSGGIRAHSELRDAPELLNSRAVPRPSWQQARSGALGFYHAVTPGTGQRNFFFDHPIYGPEGGVIGVLSIALDLEAIEADWRGDRDAIYFTDSNGVIFVTNRDELILRATRANTSRAARYADLELPPLPEVAESRRYGVPLQRELGVPGLPDDVMHLEREVPRIAMTAHLLSDIAPSAAQARFAALMGALLGGVAALALALVVQRRAAFRARLAERAAAQVRLEGMVEDRTKELRAANVRMKAEVDERTRTEAELRRVQADLVQAGKLTALGEMSAGISHELNQPLTAIQTLADNSQLFLEKSRVDAVEGNLSRISQLAARTGRILKNLRAFARKEGEPATDVDLRDVIEDALALSEARLAEAEASVDWLRTEEAVMVRGGRVRLQQVLVNLLSNAADAMAGQPAPRRIEIALGHGGGEVTLTVRDTGPGLQDPDRMFDPFHTTKPVGEGLGLGLSISYGIVQSFGGKITGANGPGGGAVFTVHLQPSGAMEAA